MVLGAWSREDRLYASNYSVISQGDLAQPLREATQRLSEGVFSCEAAGVPPATAPASFTPPPPLAHIAGRSLYIGADHAILQLVEGEAVPVAHGDTPLKADGTMMGPPGRPHRPARPRPPGPAIAKRGPAGNPPAGGAPRPQPRL
jgi:hypothetical protein